MLRAVTGTVSSRPRLAMITFRCKILTYQLVAIGEAKEQVKGVMLIKGTWQIPRINNKN